MTFRVGMKVVCVDDAPYRDGTPTGLQNGHVYTVREIFNVIDRLGQYGVALREVDAPRSYRRMFGYANSRFRPVAERKTSIEIFKQILRDVTARENVRA